jgi:predicted membrane protein
MIFSVDRVAESPKTGPDRKHPLWINKCCLAVLTGLGFHPTGVLMNSVSTRRISKTYMGLALIRKRNS